MRRHTQCWQRTMAVTRRVISLLICNHIPVNTNLSPVPADHTNDIRHSSTFPQGPVSYYFLILDVTPPMSNWPSILRVVTRMQGGCWGREDFPICINLPSISSQHGGWRMNLTWPCLNFTEPSWRLQISVKSLERKHGTLLAAEQFPVLRYFQSWR